MGRLFPSIRGRGRRGESSELLLMVGAGESSASATDTNNTSFETPFTRKRTIEEIWGSKTSSKKPLKCMSHKTTSRKTPRKFAILSRVKPRDFRFVTFLTEHLWWLLLLIHVISQVWSPTTVVWSFLNKKVSYFEPFQSRPKGIIRLWNRAFEASMSKKTCAKLCLKKWSGH